MRPRVGSQQPGGVAQQRRLAGAVAPHQRDALARRERERDAAQDRRPVAQLVPHAAHRERRPRARCVRRARPRERARGGVRTAGRAARGQRSRRRLLGSRPSRAQRRARLRTPTGAGCRPASANSLAPGVCSAGARVAGPLQERRRVAVAGDAARASSAITRSARAEAALEAVLGEHDRRLPLLVEPAQQPDQLVAGDRVELRGRLVEQHDPRAPGERRAERDALLLAAGELVRGAVEQRVDAERQRDLLDPARDRRRALRRGFRAPARARRARSSSRAASRGPGTARRRTRRAAPGRARACRGRRARRDRRSARRGSAAPDRRRRAAASTCRCPRAPRAGRTRPAAISRLTSLQRRALDARVAVGDVLEGQQRAAHGSIPRRSQNGSSTAASSAAHERERARRRAACSIRG